MIGFGNIKLYDLMTAGYISAATFRFLQPRRKLSDLSVNEIARFDYKYKRELYPLFNDDGIYLSLICWEKLEHELSINSSLPFDILENCLDSYPFLFRRYVYNLGQKYFLQNYIYCTQQVLMSRLSVKIRYQDFIYKLRHDFRLSYYEHCLSNTEIDDKQKKEVKNIVEDNLSTANTVLSGEGFSPSDHINIEDDAVSSANIGCKKYVLFLYSLDKERFDPIVEYMCHELNHVSIRVKNAIQRVGYRNFLINYLYADFEKLLKIHNFGRKSIFEFDEIRPLLYNYIQSLYNQHDTHILESELEEEIANHKDSVTLSKKIGEDKFILLEQKLAVNLEKLSVRAQNGIKYYQGDFIEDFVFKRIDVRSIKNIGHKSASEIKDVIDELRKYAEILEDSDISEKDFDIIQKEIFYEEYFDNFAESFLKEKGHLPMFYMLNNFFRNEYTRNREFQIYNLRTPIFKEKKSKQLEDIADDFSITRERVRQIYLKYRKFLIELNINTKGDSVISLMRFFENIDDWKYVKDDLESENFICLSMLGSCGANENHNFTSQFVLFIVSLLLKETYVSIGCPLLPYPSNSNDKWNNCYLVKKELANNFDFIKLLELIEDYKDSNTEDLHASAREMILDTFFSAWIDYNSSLVEDISAVVDNLLIQELGIIPDNQFCYTVEGKKVNNVEDIIYDILKSNGNPLSCEELIHRIEEFFPNKYKTAASIKYIVGRDSRLCLVGINNLVALMEWEHVKLGSIRNIIVQYLEEFDEPKQAKDIVAYVQKYRDTSDNSIRASMGSGDQFVQFSGGYYGLSWKQYPDVFYLDESDRTFYKRVQELEQFLQIHKHFPFPSSDREEQDLHDWWIYVKSYLKLSNYQKDEVKRIETKYKNLASKKKYLRWFDNCRQYSEFVQEHHRRPSKSIPDEHGLCVWLQKASEDFSNGTLTYQQELCYLDLCKSL